MSEKITVLIADDHPLFREGLKSLLSTDLSIEVIGEATTGSEAIDMAKLLQPDIILLDIQMPEINGIEATKKILLTSPHIRILAVSASDDDYSIFSMIEAGARGYILKDTGPDQILRAVKAVGDSEAIFSSGVAERLVDFFGHMNEPTKDGFPDLTQRERDVLDLIGYGLSNAEIAERLGLRVKTISNHVSNIFNKLQVADRVQAALKAREGRDPGSLPF
jgi:DNA-binding NarL/FixJ family response regulator